MTRTSDTRTFVLLQFHRSSKVAESSRTKITFQHNVQDPGPVVPGACPQVPILPENHLGLLSESKSPLSYFPQLLYSSFPTYPYPGSVVPPVRAVLLSSPKSHPSLAHQCKLPPPFNPPAVEPLSLLQTCDSSASKIPCSLFLKLTSLSNSPRTSEAGDTTTCEKLIYSNSNKESTARRKGTQDNEQLSPCKMTMSKAEVSRPFYALVTLRIFHTHVCSALCVIFYTELSASVYTLYFAIYIICAANKITNIMMCLAYCLEEANIKVSSDTGKNVPQRRPEQLTSRTLDSEMVACANLLSTSGEFSNTYPAILTAISGRADAAQQQQPYTLHTMYNIGYTCYVRSVLPVGTAARYLPIIRNLNPTSERDTTSMSRDMQINTDTSTSRDMLTNRAICTSTDSVNQCRYVI